MATIKLKPQPVSGTVAGKHVKRGPLRGLGSAPRKRPTIAEAQAERAKRADRAETPPEPTATREPPRHESAGPRRKPPRVAAPKLGPEGHQMFDAEAFERARATRQAAQHDNPDAPRPVPNEPPARRTGPRDDLARRHAAPLGDPFGRPAPQRYPDRDSLRHPDRSDRQAVPGPVPHRPALPRHGPARPLAQHPAQHPARPAARSRRDPDDDDAPTHAEVPGSLRLSKRMSALGLASRREADEWIAKGWVRVDGRVVNELGSRVLPDQQITLDARARGQQAQKVTVLLNKPVGYVSGQAEDGYQPAVVLVTPANQWREDSSGTRYLREHLRSLVPAGRLDIDSVGLLVLTQDGRVAKQLIGEDSDIEKEYLVRVAAAVGNRLSADGLALLNHGLELDGEALRPARVEWVNDDQLRFVLNQGKKRQIRRMCEAVGLQVLGLKRVRIGHVMLGDLPAGQWRYLRGDESFVKAEPR